jgi:Tat protein secretion system quality control protein TatD with DNase activity
MELGIARNKFISIHCVYEWDKLYKALDALDIKDYDHKILLHSFQAESKLVDKFKKFNCWFSLSPGCLVEKNYQMIKSLPMDLLVLESDAPSMFNKAIYDNEEQYNFYIKNEDKNIPQNHPMSILQLGKVLSELFEIGYEDFMKIITKNNKKLISKLL